jgi:hypothetical protein
MDYGEEQLFLTVEVGIDGASGVTSIFRNLLRHGTAEPVT